MAQSERVEKDIIVQELIKERVKEAAVLYEKHAKNLEADHFGSPNHY